MASLWIFLYFIFYFVIQVLKNLVVDHFLSSCFEMVTLLVKLYLDTMERGRASEYGHTGCSLHKELS